MWLWPARCRLVLLTGGTETSRNLPHTVLVVLGGKQFRTRLTSLSRFPASRLARISAAASLAEARQWCDGIVPGQDQDPSQLNRVE